MIIKSFRILYKYGCLVFIWQALNWFKGEVPKYLSEKFSKALLFIFNVLDCEQVQTSINDVKLYVDPRNPWSLRSIVLSPYYDKLQISTIRNANLKNYTFFDIGANFGTWTFSLADTFSQVISVEPEIRCYECLMRTKSDMCYQNIEIVHAGLSDQNGKGYFFPNLPHIGDGRIYSVGEREGTPVRLMSFDALASEYAVNRKNMFIKLDVQGVEPLVLQGMEKSMKQAADIILLTEIDNPVLVAAGSSKDGYLALLKELGFVPVDILADFRTVNWCVVESTLATQRDYCFRLSQ
jgi:FkbM family methyltransferase